MSTFDQKPCKEPRKPRRRLEAELEQQCTDFLALDGWRCIKTDLPHLRGLGVQEKGMADRLYIRYGAEINQQNAQVIWIEFKAPKGTANPHQLLWHAAERARGALVWVGGQNFAADYGSFVAFYRESGLLRRKGL